MDYKFDPNVTREPQYDPGYNRLNLVESLNQISTSSPEKILNSIIGFASGLWDKGTAATGVGAYLGNAANTAAFHASEEGGTSHTLNALRNWSDKLGKSNNKAVKSFGRAKRLVSRKAPLATGILRDTGGGIKELLRSIATTNYKKDMSGTRTFKPFGAKTGKVALIAALLAGGYKGLGNIRDILSDRN